MAELLDLSPFGWLQISARSHATSVIQPRAPEFQVSEALTETVLHRVETYVLDPIRRALPNEPLRLSHVELRWSDGSEDPTRQPVHQDNKAYLRVTVPLIGSGTRIHGAPDAPCYDAHPESTVAFSGGFRSYPRGFEPTWHSSPEWVRGEPRLLLVVDLEPDRDA